LASSEGKFCFFNIARHVLQRSLVDLVEKEREMEPCLFPVAHPAWVPPHSTVVGCGVHLTGQHIVVSWNHTARYSGHTACHTGITINCGATKGFQLIKKWLFSSKQIVSSWCVNPLGLP